MLTMIRRILLAALFLSIAGPVLAQTGDVPGSQDHRLISRYEGSVIIDYETKDFDDYELLLGPNSGKAKNLDKGQRLEGAVTKIRYLAPKGRSTLEVYRNYENALKQAGFEILFACADQACGRHFTNIYKDRNRDYLLRKGKQQRFLAARVVGEEGDVFVSLLKFYVVGHTDNAGTLAHNMDLSQRRAEAVVHKLVTDYDIAAEHLAAVGVGPVAPVASNNADEGRALNRRVELVPF